ncbi:hypothetical protein HN011_011529 [Eciton burchellii]|nr:hypothetical protein HN011_011529 [Eciton burchellii]
MRGIVATTHQLRLAPWDLSWNRLCSASEVHQEGERGNANAERRITPGSLTWKSLRACDEACHGDESVYELLHLACRERTTCGGNCVSRCFACCPSDAPNGTNRSRCFGLGSNTTRTNAAVTYDDSRKDQGYSPDRSLLNSGASCPASLTAYMQSGRSPSGQSASTRAARDARHVTNAPRGAGHVTAAGDFESRCAFSRYFVSSQFFLASTTQTCRETQIIVPRISANQVEIKLDPAIATSARRVARDIDRDAIVHYTFRCVHR